MLNIKFRKRFTRATGLFLVALLGSLFASLFVSIIEVNTNRARAEGPGQSEILSAQVDPVDSTFWVVWKDQLASIEKKVLISHYNPFGQPLAGFGPFVIDPSLGGFVMIPGSPRYYFLNKDPGSGNLTAINYLDLQTGKVETRNYSGEQGSCTTTTLDFVYNPDLKHLYLTCGNFIYPSPPENRSLVLDVASGTITGSLPFQVRGISQPDSRLYAVKSYVSEELMSRPPYPSPLPVLDLFIASTRTEEPLATPPLIKAFGPGGSIRSLHVNSRTGYVYVIRSSCYAKCTLPSELVFNREEVKVLDAVAPVESFNLINEVTNQLYGPRLQNVNREVVAVDGSANSNLRLAGFYWNPLAVDQVQNLVYAVDRRNSSYSFNSSQAPTDQGLGILVMDGTNYDIVRFIQIKPPDFPFSSKATRVNPPQANFNGSYFSETGHTLSGRFLDYWNSHGALSIFGYPVTEPFDEVNLDNGKVYQVQYFERNRFEYHPELAGTPYEVELGLLGRSFSALTGPGASGNFSSGETGPVKDGVVFRETGHTLTGKFQAYWNKNGGLAQFGLPLTETYKEISPIDGNTYLVQYFERARFEYHPEFGGSAFEVELGLLGTQNLRSRGWPV